ncbi:MAG: bifunctional nuclease family protein [Nitrospirae bacterium]|nr:MAG: bifunctional nuclease family protein [Nitrospirota bacterium]
MKQLRWWVWFGMVVGCGSMLSGSLAGAASGAKTELVQIKDVEVRLSERGPVVLLKAESRTIPIFVDPTVAGSIHGAVTGEKFPRPLSHDLMHAILTSFGGQVSRAVITLKGGTYYGALTVTMPGSSRVFDSRSSDAIALAVHFKAPILVGRDLLESAGQPAPESKELSL